MATLAPPTLPSWAEHWIKTSNECISLHVLKLEWWLFSRLPRSCFKLRCIWTESRVCLHFCFLVCDEGEVDQLIPTVLRARRGDLRLRQPSSATAGLWTGSHLGTKRFPAATRSWLQAERRSRLSWAGGVTKRSSRKIKGTGRGGVVGGSHSPPSREESGGRKARLLCVWPGSRDDSAGGPGRELCHWNPRPIEVRFTNSQGPLSSSHEVRTQPTCPCF